MAAHGIAGDPFDPPGSIIDAGISQFPQQMGKQAVDFKTDTAPIADNDLVKQRVFLQIEGNAVENIHVFKRNTGHMGKMQ